MGKKWEEFLTERDKQHLVVSGRGGREPFGLGEHPAVIVVDNYYSVLGTVREPILESVKSWPMSCGLDGWAAIDLTVGLLDVARKANVPIVYLRSYPGFPSPWGSRTSKGSRYAHLPAEVAAKANEIVEEIAPQPGDLVLQKTSPSGFYGTPLLFHLNYLRVDTLVVVGEATSGCVRATVVDGATHRFRIAVVEECCYDRTEASHWINLFDMDQKYADILDLEATKSYLRKSAT